LTHHVRIRVLETAAARHAAVRTAAAAATTGASAGSAPSSRGRRLLLRQLRIAAAGRGSRRDRRRRSGRRSIGVALELSVLARVHEQITERGIERRAAPVHTAVITWHLESQAV